MNLLSLVGVLKDPKNRVGAASTAPGTEGLCFWAAPSAEALQAEVAHVTADSRDVKIVDAIHFGAPTGAPGERGGRSVFVAVRGTKVDGHDYLAQVLASGAAAAVVAEESRVQELVRSGKLQISPADPPVVLVPDTRLALDVLARRLFYDPSHRLLCFGVTGTNGKTSSVYLLEHLLTFAKMPTGVLGTINHHLGEKVWESTHTTPDPVRLQSRLNEMKELGAQAIAMEVSSHALDQHRADGVQFNIVLFTNLTRDHLDYHQTEEAYFKAKERLFTELLWSSQKVPLFAVVNTDDAWGRRLRISGRAGLFTIGQNKDADFRFEVLAQDFAGQRFMLHTPLGDFEGELPLIGKHNLYNAVGAIAAVTAAGLSPDRSLLALKNFGGIPGRLQRVPDRLDRYIFVDYAHTPDALENVLRTLNEIRASLQKGAGASSEHPPRILTLFGCGGDRDKGKRPQMAQIAARLSDEIWITSDNPRGEDPAQILREIRAGIPEMPADRVHEDLDRAKAIGHIIRAARPGDVVLIAGKGHEDYQEIQGEKRPFSDVAIAADVLKG
ncbi:MAG: UDP-N-acetylmuramoyl-L-alanyl-D-glutamate--2,6-diaminopimelate ligase [Bdellovibrionaceae bacterium]|nr:UDP-N-acetylmuramoyl-L-alanyl-D-glutamate--2,6-diaminopimelate ligase [Pseudobdellovibrionaceae bacterium]